MSGHQALVLAGGRPGDPLAAAAGAESKVLVPLAGRPMVQWVLETLEAAPSIGPLAVAIADEHSLAGPEATRLPLSDSPEASLLTALEHLEAPYPLIVTTGDHPLLSVEMIEHFCAALPEDADAVVALASASVIGAAYPETRRTYYRLGGEGYSGCNLFALRTPAACRLVALWAELGRHRKQPWRIASAVGPGTLARFALGRLSLQAAMARLSVMADCRVRAVELPFAEAAMDVDKASDLALAEAILARRDPAMRPGDTP
ncbi:MAG: NTP transferase domain-containing protein [Pseudomonadota bacterium]